MNKLIDNIIKLKNIIETADDITIADALEQLNNDLKTIDRKYNKRISK